MNEQTKQRIEENRAKHIRPESDGGRLSLVSMLGKKVIDLEGYISSEYGFDSPIFDVTGVILEDGTILRLQGEHDIVYFPADDVPGLTNRDLLLAFDPNDIDEEEDDDFQEYLDNADEDHKLEDEIKRRILDDDEEEETDKDEERDGFDPDTLNDENDEERRMNRY